MCACVFCHARSFDEYDDDYDDAFDEEGFNVDAAGVEQGGDNGEAETKASGLSLLEEDDEEYLFYLSYINVWLFVQMGPWTLAGPPDPNVL